MSDVDITTKQSPRYEGGTWKWYPNNTFSLIYKFRLRDSDNSYILVDPSDTISARFYDKRGNLVHEFDFEDLTQYYTEDNPPVPYTEISIDFTSAISAMFPVGKYTFCITYYGDSTTTVAANQKVEVEECH